MSQIVYGGCPLKMAARHGDPPRDKEGAYIPGHRRVKKIYNSSMNPSGGAGRCVRVS